MNGNVRNYRNGLFEIDRHGLYPAVRFYNEPARNRKRSVRPRRTQHSAVAFNREFNVIAVFETIVFLFILNVGESRCAAVIIKPVKSPFGTLNAIRDEPFLVT